MAYLVTRIDIVWSPQHDSELPWYAYVTSDNPSSPALTRVDESPHYCTLADLLAHLQSEINSAVYSITNI